MIRSYMRRSFFTSAVWLLFCLALPAFVFAGVKEEQVGPGLIYSEISQPEVPWEIRTVRVDLTSPHIHLSNALSSNGIGTGLERASELSKRMDKPGEHVAAAVNGDFWGEFRQPVGSSVVNGELARSPNERDAFVIKEDGTPAISIFQMRCSIRRANGKDITVVGVNHWEDVKQDAILFNHWIGTKIPSKEKGVGWVLNPQGNILTTKSRFLCTVERPLKHQRDGVPMPEGKLVLWSVVGNDFDLKEGEDVAVDLSLTPDFGVLKTAVGGHPQVVKDGKPLADEGTFSTTQHPRTAVGFSQDGKQLLLLVVDGRQTGWSRGMSLKELGEKMLELGCYQAMNLDGGGSSTMVVWNQVKNHPSDKSGERPVANSLQVLSKAPQDDLLTLSIEPSEIRLLPKSKIQFSAKGVDSFKQPVDIDPKKISWGTTRGWFLLNHPIGSISKDGMLKTGSWRGKGSVVAKSDKLAGKARVTVEKPKSLKIEPSKLDLALGHDQRIHVAALGKDGRSLLGEPTALFFSFEGDCGQVTKDGVFQPAKPGDGKVLVSLAGLKAEVPVHVAESQRVVLEDFEDVSDWKIETVLAESASCGVIETREQLKVGDRSGKFFYKMNAGGTSGVYLTTDKAWEGKGEAIKIWVYGDGSGHMLRSELKDDKGNSFLITLASRIDWKGEWKQIRVPLSDAAPHYKNPTAKMDRLCRLVSVYLAETREDHKNASAIYLDDLEVFTVPVK